MIIVPIMDLKNGFCVHSGGDAHNNAVVELSVVAVASQWIKAGVTRLHIIDVDAIGLKEPVNVSAVRTIKQAFPELAIEVSGGVYCEDDILIWLDSGADHLVLNGNNINHISNLEAYCIEYPGKIMLAIDVMNGRPMNPALMQSYGSELIPLLTNLDEQGLSGVILTNKRKIKGAIENRPFYNDINHQITRESEWEMKLFLHGDKHIFKHKNKLQSDCYAGVSGLLMGREIYEHQLFLSTLIQSLS